MDEILKRMQAERLRLVGEQRAIIDAAETANRELTAEENEGFEQRDAAIRRIDARVKDLNERAQRDKDAEEAFRSLLEQPPVDDENRGREGGKPDEQEQVRSWLSGQSGQRTLDLRAGRPMGIDEFRALSKLTAGAGANTVKTSFYDKLIAHLIEVSGIMQAGPTIMNTSTGEQIQIPKTTAHSTAALTAEAAAIGLSEPVFGQVPLDAFKYANLIQVSNELVNDTSVDLIGYLAMQAGRAVGNAFGVHAITGTGSAQPNGIATAASTGITGATGVTGAFSTDNLIDLFYSVIAPYRASPSCGWLLRDATMASVRKLKDSTGQFLWQPSLQLGTPDMLLGKPIYNDPFVAAVGLNAKSVLFGDISQYFVRMVDTIRFERSGDYAFNTDMVTFRCILRADGDLVDTTGAVKAFVGAAS